jgi:hypothetical protein
MEREIERGGRHNRRLIGNRGFVVVIFLSEICIRISV